MDAKKILVVGSANIDLVVRVSQIPQPGETLIGSSFTTVCGGKGANQAVAAARLGASVSFLGCVGDDGFATLQRESLSAAGVHLDYLKTVTNQPTGTAVIEVSDAGENSIVVVPGANFEVSPDDIYAARAAFEAVDVVLLQLEVPVATVEAALDLAKATGTLSVLDIGSDQEITPDVLGKATVVSPNRSEASRLTGLTIDTTEDALKAARHLLDFGVEHVVMKLGASGSHYVGRHQDISAPAFSVDVVDTTAAGDAFTAALGVRWGCEEIPALLRYANAVGALATTTAGAQPSLPEAAAVKALLAR